MFNDTYPPTRPSASACHGHASAKRWVTQRMLRIVAPVARIGISGGSARSGAGGAVGGPWIAMSAFDGLFGFEVVLESAFLR